MAFSKCQIVLRDEEKFSEVCLLGGNQLLKNIQSTIKVHPMHTRRKSAKKDTKKISQFEGEKNFLFSQQIHTQKSESSFVAIAQWVILKKFGSFFGQFLGA